MTQQMNDRTTEGYSPGHPAEGVAQETTDYGNSASQHKIDRSIQGSSSGHTTNAVSSGPEAP